MPPLSCADHYPVVCRVTAGLAQDLNEDPGLYQPCAAGRGHKDS
jgi:hypothetical protein